MEEAIPIPHLRQLWSRSLGGSAGSAEDWSADRLVIWGLGLGLQETLQFLHGRKPDFAQFEQWVIDCNDGAVSERRVAEVNGQLARLGRRGKTPAGLGPAPALSEAELRFWGENGYVVLRRAVEPAAAEAAGRAVWEFLGMSPDDPDGWYGDADCDGIFVKLARHPAFAANRASPRIRQAFAQLWGTGDLAVTVDRCGFNPPERPGHGFRGQGLHWDTSLSPPVPLDIQGLLYLTDTPEELGAFHCVPGFHRKIDGWLAALPPEVDPRAEDLSAGAVKVPGRAGDLVIWQSALPHGATPNRGVQPRLVQYISCFPVERVDARPWL